MATFEQSIEDLVYLAPRCEYFTRYPGSTHFKMDNYRHWGTYPRSTPRGGNSSRWSKQYFNPNLSQVTFMNPHVENTKPNKMGTGGSGTELFYDSLLEYRQNICCLIKDEFEALNQVLDLQALNLEALNPEALNPKPRISIIHTNQSCLFVKISLVDSLQIDRESFNELLMAWYVAIINKEAEEASIPIEMVIRSGFGHLSPSVDVTDNTFRINVGIVPKAYAKLIVKSLLTLQATLSQLKTPLPDGPLVQRIYQTLQDTLLPPWNITTSPFDLLTQKITARSTVVREITRMRYYRDVFANLVLAELDHNPTPNITNPIIGMLGFSIYRQSQSQSAGHSE